MGSMKIRYAAISTTLLIRHRRMAVPMLLWASSLLLAPREMLTKAQQPSPIITAMERATTVSGNTTVFAALP